MKIFSLTCVGVDHMNHDHLYARATFHTSRMQWWIVWIDWTSCRGLIWASILTQLSSLSFTFCYRTETIFIIFGVVEISVCFFSQWFGALVPLIRFIEVHEVISLDFFRSATLYTIGLVQKHWCSLGAIIRSCCWQGLGGWKVSALLLGWWLCVQRWTSVHVRLVDLLLSTSYPSVLSSREVFSIGFLTFHSAIELKILLVS